MITLRPNQVEPVRAAVAYFKETKPVPAILIAPTAFGKSVLVAAILQEFPNDSFVVIQPSVELLRQNRGKFELTGNDSDVYSASFGQKSIGRITFATIGSIYKIGHEFRGVSKIIVDECHLYPRKADSMFGKFLKDSGITHVLGLTATPFKLQTNTDRMGYTYSKLVMLTNPSGKGNFFKKIISVSQVQDIVKLGYWSKLEYYKFQTDTSMLRMNSSGSEFTDASIERMYKKNKNHDRIKTIIEKSKRQSILVFVPSVAEAKSLSEQFNNSAYVCGETDKKERAQIIEDFKKLRIRVVFNVNVLSVGFDHPLLDCIILARSTASVAWYYQALGRITRIHYFKDRAIIVDLSGCVDRFGKIEDFVFHQKGNRWEMYSNNIKLTGIPMDEIGKHKL